MIRNDIPYQIIPRAAKKLADDATLDIANKILDNYFFENNEMELIYMGDNYDNWTYKHETSANTYQLYIHSLDVITYLVDAYLIDNNKKYLKKAYEILISWNKYNKEFCRRKKRFAWVDHSASNRIISILYLYLVAFNVIDIDKQFFYDSFIEHVDYLYNYDYMKDNHGIMLDKALLMLSFFIEDKNYKEKIYTKSFYRLRGAFYRDFSRQGVHLENSVDYHSFTKKIFQDIQDFLKYFNESLGEEIEYFLENDNYFSHIMLPDGYLPMIGDSGKTYVKNTQKIYDNFYDTEAGIYLIQNKSKKLQISFVCGYSKQNHKHHDDLSFNLYYEGKKIFLDTGKYNYDRNSEIRQYMLSTYAHNTISVDEGYTIKEDYKFLEKPRVHSFYNSSTYDFIRGVNEWDKGIHERTLIYIKVFDLILIHDKVMLENAGNITQIFNVNPELTIEKEKEKIIINGKFTVEQLLPNNSFEIADTINDKRTIMSENFGTTTDIKQIQTKLNTDEGEFLTAISLNNKNKFNIKMKNNRIKVRNKFKTIFIYL